MNIRDREKSARYCFMEKLRYAGDRRIAEIIPLLGAVEAKKCFSNTGYNPRTWPGKTGKPS
jgi:hypothetical protein